MLFNSRATGFVYFPFLKYKVEHSSIGLDIADGQSAPNMTIAVRNVDYLGHFIAI